MLLTLIGAGLLVELPAGEGEVIAADEATVIVPALQSVVPINSLLPYGSLPWKRALDPKDRAPYAMRWDALLGEGVTIADIASITMSAAGAALGVQVVQDTDYLPLIGSDARSIQLWLQVDPSFRENAAFSGPGVQVGLSVAIVTDEPLPRRYERTAVVTVRQQ